MPLRIKHIRSKKVSKVLFVITEVGPWKTKELYKAMVKHKRFSPFIGISESCEVPDEKKELIHFLKNSGIPFGDLDKDTKNLVIKYTGQHITGKTVIFTTHVHSEISALHVKNTISLPELSGH